MNTTCYWMWTGLPPWVADITKPPASCPFPQQCIEPEQDGTYIGEPAENQCREDPTP